MVRGKINTKTKEIEGKELHMKRVAFTGWAGSGKTLAANYLMKKHNGEVISFAEGIKHIDGYLFDCVTKNRLRLQKIGEFFRTIDPDIWVKKTRRTIDSHNNSLFIDDLRRLNEYEMLIEQGFVVIRIVSDECVRIKRLIERDGCCDKTLLYNESEAGCSDLELLEIENNGALEELYGKLDYIMQGGAKYA